MRTLRRLPLAVRIAQALSRVVTWGTRNDRRREFLAESDEDWELMYSDQGSQRVLIRAIRGVPTTVWARMEDRDHTALPTATAFTVIAVAGTGAGLLDHAYPEVIRRFILISAVSIGMVGVTMARSPRNVPLRRLRIPMLALATGFLGMAANMPAESDWQYNDPFIDTMLPDSLIVLGFATIGIGGLVLAFASMQRAPRQLFHTGGTAIVAGSVLFGVGLVTWGVIAVTVDPAVTATSIPIGLGAISLAHVGPRLRHLITE